MEATEMSTDRWMDKESVVDIYNRILLSHKKEHIWVSSNEVDETRAYYTEWSKLEREKQILYVNGIYMESRKKVLMTYLEGSSGDTDIENRLVDTVGEGVGGMNGKSVMETYTLPYAKYIASGNLLYVWCSKLKSSAHWPSEGRGWGGRWEEHQSGGNICIPMTDSCWCTAEINTML